MVSEEPMPLLRTPDVPVYRCTYIYMCVFSQGFVNRPPIPSIALSNIEREISRGGRLLPLARPPHREKTSLFFSTKVSVKLFFTRHTFCRVPHPITSIITTRERDYILKQQLFFYVRFVYPVYFRKFLSCKKRSCGVTGKRDRPTQRPGFPLLPQRTMM